MEFDAVESVANSRLPRERLEVTEAFGIYEGLPHQFFEPELLAREQLRDDVTELCGFPFYVAKQTVSDGIHQKLHQLLVDDNSLNDYRGPKRCGGFHPDFAVAWDDQQIVMICFGCREVVYRSGDDYFHHDLKESAKDQLVQLLSNRGIKRPKGRNQIR